MGQEPAFFDALEQRAESMLLAREYACATAPRQPGPYPAMGVDGIRPSPWMLDAGCWVLGAGCVCRLVYVCARVSRSTAAGALKVACCHIWVSHERPS